MNLFSFTGNLGQDAEVKTVGSGTTLCEMSVAVKSGYGDKEKTNWVRCVMFGKKAEGALPGYLTKGTSVAVSGELSLEQWEKDGKGGAALAVNVQNIDLIGGKSQQDQGQQQSAPAQQAPYQQAPQQAPQMAPKSSPLGYYYDDGQPMSPEHVTLYKGSNVQPWAKGTPAPGY